MSCIKNLASNNTITISVIPKIGVNILPSLLKKGRNQSPHFKWNVFYFLMFAFFAFALRVRLALFFASRFLALISFSAFALSLSKTRLTV